MYDGTCFLAAAEVFHLRVCYVSAFEMVGLHEKGLIPLGVSSRNLEWTRLRKEAL